MAKVGALFLNGGRWKGERIISQNWIERSTTYHVRLRGGRYGYLWWRPTFYVNGETVEVFSAQGYGGQVVFVLPELDMVVVFTSSNYEGPPKADQPFEILDKYILNAVR